MASLPDAAQSLLTGDNAAFVDQLWESWLSDPGSVAPEWAAIFAAAGDPAPARRSAWVAPSIFHGRAESPGAATQAELLAAAQRQARVAQLINAYRVRGHTEARIDPLQQQAVVAHPELTLGYHGLTEGDLDQMISGRPLFGVPEVTTLRHVVGRLRKAYCGTFGVEFMNINEPEKKRWLQQRFETLQDTDVLSPEQERWALRQLADAENFERLLHNRFPGTKRFSLEGAETLIPLLDMLIERTADLGVSEIIFGMAHRGRLNVLANVLGKPIPSIVLEFEDMKPDSFHGSGDVKYHLGYSAPYTTRGGKAVELSLAFNPSHLEAVDPVVEGRVRARQDRRGSGAERATMPVLIHGDAAFAGQGVVTETLQLSGLAGYRTGGTVHIIINNQIGFTTSPKDARSTPYCTDVARMLGIPIFHVNGEDVEAVAAVVAIAAEWRQTFGEDVVIDMYCFRKHGHNEGDEPSFTQPLLYEAIRTHPSPRVVYARKMVEERRSLSREEAESIVADSASRLDEALARPPEHDWDSYSGNPSSPIGRYWSRYRGSLADPVETGLDRGRLVDLLTSANTIPAGFHAHRKIERLMEQRLDLIRGDKPIDWALGEQAAYASLVTEGLRVRLSGQDCGRGTFSHRHAVLTDIRDGSEHVPLDRLAEGQARFEVFDSSLSEAAVLGFEYGWSLDYPDGLVLWEAQFGDFANGAQIIIDNFIMAGEQKWNRCSGLVMLLPHGYEGQGPEHSSARLERFLQLCAEENVFVANCTTPASFFHLLRRQALQPLRKPLVVMSPKSLLRHPDCVSSLDELAHGRFEPLLVDREVAAPRRLVFCSGKVYYELKAARAAFGASDVALLRLEQLYPFPAAQIREVLAAHPQAEVVWCQEEPRNMGAWPILDEWFAELLDGRAPRYVGRLRAAAPATGSPRKHRKEQDAILAEALR